MAIRILGSIASRHSGNHPAILVDLPSWGGTNSSSRLTSPSITRRSSRSIASCAGVRRVCCGARVAAKSVG
jgi:hypothetical protein